jgi:hypothetical protein
MELEEWLPAYRDKAKPVLLKTKKRKGAILTDAILHHYSQVLDQKAAEFQKQISKQHSVFKTPIIISR